MKEKKLTSKLLLPTLMMFLVVTLSIVLLNQKKEIGRLKMSNVFLAVGDELKQLDLTDISNNQMTHRLNNGVSILFVFEKPCSPCNKNINYWNKIAILLRKSAQSYGIIEDDFENAKELKMHNRVIFPLYTPVNAEEFRRILPTSINLPQTVVVRDGKISNLYVGQLDADLVKEIVQKATL